MREWPQTLKLYLIGFFALLFGFAMVWYMYWLAIGSLIGIVALLVYRLSQKEPMQIITAKEVMEEA